MMKNLWIRVGVDKIDKIMLALIFLMSMTAFAIAGHTPPMCNLYDLMSQKLVDTYGEQLIKAKKLDENSRVELWYSENTHAYTALVVSDPMSCVIASGAIDSGFKGNLFPEIFKE